jgi:hypothetical protein
MKGLAGRQNAAKVGLSMEDGGEND